MAHLGFQGRVINGSEVILPPVCDVATAPFFIGSDPKRDSVAKKTNWAVHEMPQHTVTLPGYDIARFPVTVAEYACFVRAGQPEPQRHEYQGTIVDWQTQLQRLDHPVVCLTWHDAVAYAAWLSEHAGEQWRVASEAEWEKAARGTDGRIYPWGDRFDKARCNTSESGIKASTPVGTYLTGASPYGAQDMAGNVWEWTSSLKLPYPYTLSGEREDPQSTGNRVLRGGSWYYVATFARAAFRHDLPPDFSSDDLGFRVVRAAPRHAP